MAYRVLANSVLLIHLGFILFVLLGGVLVYWKRKILFLHIPAAAWGAFVEFSGWICPLTPLENLFRNKAGQMGYSGDFLENYITQIIYLEGLTQEMQIVFGIIVLVFNSVIYGWLIKNWMSARKSHTKD